MAFCVDLLVGNPTSTGLIAFIYPCFSTSIGVQGRNMKFLLPSEFHSLNLFDDSGLFSETGVFAYKRCRGHSFGTVQFTGMCVCIHDW